MSKATAATPLLLGHPPVFRRRQRRSGVGLAVAVVALVSGVALVRRSGFEKKTPGGGDVHVDFRTEEEELEAEAEERLREMEAYFWSPPVLSSWNATSAASRDGSLDAAATAAVDLEEHYVFSTSRGDFGRSSHIFLKQAYTYWRYGLNGPRRMRDPSERSARVRSYRYNTKRDLLEKLRGEEISGGALVFISVTTMALDREMRDYDSLQREPYDVSARDDLRQTRRDVELYGRETMDVTCLYQHTPDVVLRSSLLRELLAYPKPLVLVLAGDSACRLKNLPRTHHFVVFPNDGAPTDRDLWYPEGLEGLEDGMDYLFWNKRAQAHAENLTDTSSDTSSASSSGTARGGPPKKKKKRTFLFDVSASINGRKPSRVALLRYLEDEGGREALIALAEEAGLDVRFNASVVDEQRPDGSYSADFRHFGFSTTDDQDDDHRDDDDRDEDDDEARALFSLAPAGDTWSSGRVLEAMLRGSVPIVDATYRTDGGASSKGCDDAAKFWQRGDASFRQGAPFLFVERWSDLPEMLRRAGVAAKEGDGALGRRLDAVQNYRDDLERYLRRSILDAALERQGRQGTTACDAVPLTDDAKDDQIRAEVAYYTSDWVGAFADRPSLPTAGCSTAFHPHFIGNKGGAPTVMPHAGIQCYAPECAPPLVGAFSCHTISHSSRF